MTENNVYFVSNSGSDYNRGTSELEAFKTIEKAAGILAPGDKLYIKAGSYKDSNLVIRNSGTADKPIHIEGYRDYPGDIIENIIFDHNSAHDPSIMPLIDGGQEVSEAPGIYIKGEFVEIKNIQVTSYKYGLLINGDNNKAQNIITSRSAAIEDDPFTGYAIKIVGDENYLANSIGVDAGGQGITVEGSNNLVEKNRYYGTVNADQNGTDYYFMIYGSDAGEGSSNNNIVRNNYIERVGDPTHVGHGFTVAGFGSGNIFEDNSAYNLKGGGYVVRHSGATGNIFMNNTSHGGNGIFVRDGASENTFIGMEIYDTVRAISLFDTDEDAENNGISGQQNVFRDIKIDNATFAISYNDYTRKDTVSIRNDFSEIFATNTQILIEAGHSVIGDVISNSHFEVSIKPFKLKDNNDIIIQHHDINDVTIAVIDGVDALKPISNQSDGVQKLIGRKNIEYIIEYSKEHRFIEVGAERNSEAGGYSDTLIFEDLSLDEVEIGLSMDGVMSSARWWDGEKLVEIIIAEGINIEKISFFDYNLVDFDEISAEADSIHYLWGESEAEEYWLPQNQVSLQI